MDMVFCIQHKQTYHQYVNLLLFFVNYSLLIKRGSTYFHMKCLYFFSDGKVKLNNNKIISTVHARPTQNLNKPVTAGTENLDLFRNL